MNHQAMDWFALRVRSKAESRVSTALKSRGYHPYFPSYSERVQWSDRMKTREVPLFPGYLFCQLDPQMPLKILTTPGVLDIVGCKGRYLPIQKQELDDIRRALAASLTVRPWAAYERGDRVRIERGPLTGLEGEVAYVKNGLRLILRVNLLNRAVAVDLDQRWVQPVHRAALETYAAMAAMRRAG